ncbi:MAG: phosphoglycerate kinase [Deltaproteobacteria bacterium]|nr:phosphoglycerate kinase [Deltaproteobacteria bacterium]
MSLKFIDQFDLKEKRVFLRVDFNVARNDQGDITDDTRIRESLPTIRYALENKGRVILASHLGRPKGGFHAEDSLVRIGERLSELLGQDLLFPEDCVGDAVRKLVYELKEGQVLLLENLRFHEEEEKNDPAFAKSLALLGDIYINDAFGTCHRAHASTVGMVSHFKEKGAGFLVKTELEFLGKLLGKGDSPKPAKPFVVVLGGAKVSDKIGVIENLLGKVDALLIGGGMSYTFLAAEGVEVGASLKEEEKVHLASRILERAKTRGIRIYLPTDHRVAAEAREGSPVETTLSANIRKGMKGLDIGPKTLDNFCKILREAKTIFWNGPMGMFELPSFAKGTLTIAREIADSGAISVTGGGDSLAAVKMAGVESKITHLSTGGGATLEFLEGKELPGIKALED